MANNLHISYDLYNPGQNYSGVIETIKTFGNWAKIHKSFWYVKSELTPQQAVERLRKVMDTSDTVYVVDSTNNTAAWHNLNDEVANHIRKHWS
jgi:thiamine pyrophosphate-dependent acetolactate synthase large subunit-like protein